MGHSGDFSPYGFKGLCRYLYCLVHFLKELRHELDDCVLLLWSVFLESISHSLQDVRELFHLFIKIIDQEGQVVYPFTLVFQKLLIP